MKMPHKAGRISEKAIQTAVFAHFRAFGVPGAMLFANANARAFGQPGLTKGVFDITAINVDGQVGFLELKTAKGKLSADQEAFRMALIRAGVRCAVAYGRDEPIRVLEDWEIIRRSTP